MNVIAEYEGTVSQKKGKKNSNTKSYRINELIEQIIKVLQI